MPANYVLLAKNVVGSAGAASVTFSSIPQTGYTDLQILLSPHTDRASYANADLALQFNGSSVSNGKSIYSANTNTVISGSLIALVQGGNNSLTGDQNLVFGPTSLYIPNYTGSTNKSVSIEFTAEGNSTDIEQTRNGMSALLWGNTAAITSITLSPNSGTIWTQNSTFYLYGIAKAGVTPTVAPYATGGDTITNDGTYFIHTFLSSGTFTPKKSLSNVDYLVVAGGGGGGKGANSGGGGAGGLRSTVTATGGGGSLESKLSLGTSAYTVTVGAGGAGGPTNGTNGTDGSNSVFSTITSTGGGGGGGSGSNNGRAGGSGGGGGLYETVGGAGTANQGYAGGPNIGLAGDATKFRAGGGGGAGAVGGGAGASVGTGGAGVATSISGSSVTYAGGGGGGANDGTAAGGAGGGGAAGSAGTTNTGGGGGGAGNSGGNNTSAGGSGIVIVRYPI
jgi:hypothetical protein